MEWMETSLDYFSYLAAQLVVHLSGRHEVVGSNPCWCVTFLAENIPVLSGRLVPNEVFVLNVKSRHFLCPDDCFQGVMTFVSLLHSPTSPLSGVSLNTCLIGLAFLCIYSAFNALANTSELMLFSYQANHAKVTHSCLIHVFATFLLWPCNWVPLNWTTAQLDDYTISVRIFSVNSPNNLIPHLSWAVKCNYHWINSDNLSNCRTL